jgi:hypothetical protein
MKHQFIVSTIVILFFGIAVAPSINLSVVKASNDNDHIEVTTGHYQDFRGLNDNETKRHTRLLSFVVFIFWLRLGRSYWFEDHSTIWIRNNQYIIHPLLWLRGQWLYLKALRWVIIWATLSNSLDWNWDALDFFIPSQSKNVG